MHKCITNDLERHTPTSVSGVMFTQCWKIRSLLSVGKFTRVFIRLKQSETRKKDFKQGEQEGTKVLGV